MPARVQTVIADADKMRHDARGDKDRLGTGVGAGIAKGAFALFGNQQDGIVADCQDILRTGIDALPATRAGGKIFRQCPRRQCAQRQSLRVAGKQATAGYAGMGWHIASVRRRPRRPVQDLQHPDQEPVSADGANGDNRPDPEGQDKECHDFAKPAGGGRCFALLRLLVIGHTDLDWV